MTLTVPRIKRTPNTWKEVLNPFTSRFGLAAKMGLDVTVGTDGCQSLHEVLVMVGERMDEARVLEKELILAKTPEALAELREKVINKYSKG